MQVQAPSTAAAAPILQLPQSAASAPKALTANVALARPAMLAYPPALSKNPLRLTNITLLPPTTRFQVRPRDSFCPACFCKSLHLVALASTKSSRTVAVRPHASQNTLCRTVTEAVLPYLQAMLRLVTLMRRASVMLSRHITPLLPTPASALNLRGQNSCGLV